MTQQNAALVEQSAAAAQSLKDQADRLAQAVAMFKVSKGQARQVIAGVQAASRAAAPSAPAASRKVTAAAPKVHAAHAKPPAPAPKPSDAKGADWEEF
jgi:methyl-accepting chemotaxis protein-2 (aspartate sensor receptor)